jgi:archaellum component FlaC
MNANTSEFREGVQLRKYVERDEYEIPSVVYEFTSERTDAVSVQVVESLPESLDPEHLGFHPRFGPENWAVRDGKLVLDVELEPESEFKTVYAVRSTAPAEPEQLVTDPEEFSVTPEREALLRGGNAERVSRSVAPSSNERATEAETPEAPSERAQDDRVETEQKGTGEDVIATDDEGGPGTQGSASSGEVTREDEIPLVDRLVGEMQAGRASDDSLDYLEQRFGTADHNSGSMDARIRQLQRDFADLRAYTGALEEFLDENGSAREVVNSLEDRLDAVDDELESLESTVDDRESDVREVREEMHDLQSEVETVTAEIDSVSEDVAELSSEIERIDDQLPAYDVEERFSELEDDIAEMSAFTTRLQEALQESFDD